MSITILRGSLAVLRFTFVWPPRSQELNAGKLYILKCFLMLLSTSILPIGSILHLINSLKFKSASFSQDVVILVAAAGVTNFIATFSIHQPSIAKILASLSEFTTSQDFEEFNKKINFLWKGYDISINICIVGFCFSPLLLLQYCHKQNDIKEFQEICGLMIAAWMPFDLNRFPVKQIFYSFQALAAIFILKAAATVAFVFTGIIDHVSYRVQQVERLLEKAINERDKDEKQKLFAEAVLYHEHILNIGHKMNKSFADSLFIHVLLTGLLFGCIGYNFRDSFNITAPCLLLGWYMSLHLECLSAQRLMDRSLAVGDAVYKSSWYDCNTDFQKCLLVVMMRSRKPIVLRTAIFGNLSHVLLMTAIKSAFSYMSVLTAMNK